MSNIIIMGIEDDSDIGWRARPPELRHLRGFLAVARTRHFGRAAALLGMAQPPLSQQIARLEASLGAALFTRARSGEKRVALTDAGRALEPLARRLIADALRAVETTRSAGRGERGILRLAFVASLAHTELPRLIRAYREAFPDVRLVLQEMATGPMLNALAQGSIDLGIGREIVASPSIDFIELFREPIVLVLPTDHRLASETGPFHPHRLAAEPLILPPRSAGEGLADRLSVLCIEAGFAPFVTQEAIEWTTIFALVAAGMGVTLAPASAATSPPPGLCVRALADGATTTSVALTWRADESSAVREHFANWLLPRVKASRS